MTEQPQNDSAMEDPNGPPPLTEEEQAMLEAQMKEIRVEDLLTQTVASVLNLSARRIVKEDEIDLEQARIGIEAVRALIALLPPEVAAAIQEPLSQVQMLYAQRSGQAGPGAESGGVGEPGEAGGPGPSDGPAGPKLWTPGGN